jgi:hypothetical protein
MCIEHLPDGRLLVVDSAGKRLLRREPDGTLAQHVDVHEFSEFDAFRNDFVIDGRGAMTSDSSFRVENSDPASLFMSPRTARCAK